MAPEDDQSAKWWRLLRRAFGVPDIVSDEHTADAVTYAYVKRLPAIENREEEANRAKDAALLVRAVVTLGARGELDELFVPLKLHPPENIDAQREKVRKECGLTIEPDEIIKTLLESLQEYVAKEETSPGPGR